MYQKHSKEENTEVGSVDKSQERKWLVLLSLCRTKKIDFMNDYFDKITNKRFFKYLFYLNIHTSGVAEFQFLIYDDFLFQFPNS